MKTRKFIVKGNIRGEDRVFRMELPVTDSDEVRTDRYCPDSLYNPENDEEPFVNVETVDEFLKDCQHLVYSMNVADEEDEPIKMHIAGLVMVISIHVSIYNRLVFKDLLLYMDCFSHLLAASQFEDNEIRAMYPRIIKTLAFLYHNYLVSDSLNTPFSGSKYERWLLKL